MKELSIEEKAKRYDVAFERAKEMIKAMTNIGGVAKVDDIQYLFPELKESEDERIRLELIRDIDIAMPIETAQKYITWLKKQGEQKPFDYKNIQQYDFTPKSAMEAIKEEKVNNQNCVKPADTVEPKFKVGDWIVYKDTVWKVCNISLLNYYELLKINNEVSTRFINDVDETAHLWTIQDAKDGDVLAVDNMIFIYKRTLANHIVSYCKLINDIFESTVDARTCCEGNIYVYPATKEQRDTLMKAMANAGWEFDFEKKELKEIEQKPIIEMKSAEESLGIDFDTYNKIVDECIFGEQKPAWSEEDEMFVHGLIRGLAAKRDIHGHTTFSSDCIDITETIYWLKSLKDRVQPKHAWSEEDEKMIQDIINDIAIAQEQVYCKSRCEEEIDWLKSLRPQNTWKPSDEQMTQLKKYCPDNRPLTSLYEQLKKLKE